MFKVWKYYKENDNLDIIPVARAIFAIFFFHSMTEKILSQAQEKGYKKSYSSTALFIGFLAITLISRFYDASDQLPDLDGLISILTVIFFVPPFKAFMYAKNLSPQDSPVSRSGFNGKQIVLVVIGSILWALIFLGMTME
jgi:hypothetical protein